MIRRSHSLSANTIVKGTLSNVTTFYDAIEDAARKFEAKCLEDATILYSDTPRKSIFGQTMFTRSKNLNYTQQ